MTQPLNARTPASINTSPTEATVRDVLQNGLTMLVAQYAAQAGTLLYRSPFSEAITLSRGQLPDAVQTIIERSQQQFNRHPASGSSTLIQTIDANTSLLSLPLCSGNTTVGIVQLAVAGAPADPGTLTLSLLRNLGSEADRLAMFQQDRQDVQELQLLYDIGQALSANLDLTSLLADMKTRVPQVMHAERCSIMLFDEEHQALVLETLDPQSEEPHSFRIPLDRGIAGWVARHGEGQIVNNVEDDPRWYDGVARDMEYTTRSILCAPMHIGERLVGVMQVLNKQQGAPFTQDDLRLLTTLAAQAAIAVENARLVRSLRAERDKLLAKEADVRAAIARDLHDGPTQSVAAIVMNISYIKRLLQSMPERVEDELDVLSDLATKTSQDIRLLLFELRPLGLETQGLLATLRQYVTNWRDPSGQMRLQLQADPQLPRLPSEREGAIFIIVQEAVNNARKHVRFGTVMIELTADDSSLIARVRDEGTGFDLADVDATYINRGSLGLLNMRERARLIGGECTISSTPGRGTTVEVRLPLTERVASA